MTDRQTTWPCIIGFFLGAVFLMMTGSGFVIAGSASPEIIVDRLTCWEFAVHIEGGTPGIEYYVALLGNAKDPDWGGFIWPPLKIEQGESLFGSFPKEYTNCWINWQDCPLYGIFQAQPEKLEWHVDLAERGETIDRKVVDMPIPCRGEFKVYLPLVLKQAR